MWSYIRILLKVYLLKDKHFLNLFCKFKACNNLGIIIIIYLLVASFDKDLLLRFLLLLSLLLRRQTEEQNTVFHFSPSIVIPQKKEKEGEMWEGESRDEDVSEEVTTSWKCPESCLLLFTLNLCITCGLVMPMEFEFGVAEKNKMLKSWLVLFYVSQH